MWRSGRLFPRQRPRAAKGGIKAQSKRGAVRRVVVGEALDRRAGEFSIGGARLQRGRSYARHGQVLLIDVGKGKVEAKVQGSQPTPYKVSIQVKRSDKEWGKVVQAAGRPGGVHGQAAGGRNAAGRRNGLPGGRPVAVPGKAGRPEQPPVRVRIIPIPASTSRRSTTCWARNSTAIRSSILAWRGRSREDLPAGLHAAGPRRRRGRPGEPPGAAGPTASARSSRCLPSCR